MPRHRAPAQSVLAPVTKHIEQDHWIGKLANTYAYLGVLRLWGEYKCYPYNKYSLQVYYVQVLFKMVVLLMSVETLPCVTHQPRGLLTFRQACQACSCLRHLYFLYPVWNVLPPDIQGLPSSLHSGLGFNKNAAERVP